MVIFGGIYEITKELNDMHIFDFERNTWINIYEDLNLMNLLKISNLGSARLKQNGLDDAYTDKKNL
jgi:hypothetical protein